MANLKTETGRPKIFTSNFEETLTPEEKLWKAVLYQGVFEALSFKYNALPLTDTEKKITRTWINPNNPDFKEVCENAGYNAMYIYNRIKNILVSKQLDPLVEINKIVANSIIERKENVG